MLLIDAITERSVSEIVCRRRFRGDEFFFDGHYPDFPIVPGVILCECAAQAAALLIAGSASVSPPASQVPVLTRMNNVRLKRMIRPGEEISISVRLNETVSGAWFLSATVRVDGKLAASLDLACASAAKPGGDASAIERASGPS